MADKKKLNEVTRESEAEEIELDEDDLESVAGGVSWEEFQERYYKSHPEARWNDTISRFLNK